MNRSFLLSLGFLLLAQPSLVLGGLYNVDLLGDLSLDQAGTHLLHVMGTIEVNTVTDEVIDSHLRFEHIQFFQGGDFHDDFFEIFDADFQRLPEIADAGIDFTDSGGMLFIGPQPTEGRLRWLAPGLFDGILELSSGNEFGPRVRLLSCFFTCDDEFVFYENGNPLMVGTTVPEPSSTVLLLTTVLGVAAIRCRRNVR